MIGKRWINYKIEYKLGMFSGSFVSRYIGKFGLIIFGVTFPSNFLSGFREDCKESVVEHPIIFTGAVLAKSSIYSILSPIFIYNVIENPRGVFIFGGGGNSNISYKNGDRVFKIKCKDGEFQILDD